MLKTIIRLTLFTVFYAATITPVNAQIPSGLDPTVIIRADNGYNASTIRNPVVMGDNIGRLQFAGWLSSQQYQIGAEIRASITGQPTGSLLPADLIFSTGATGLKNRFRIGANGLAGFNSDDLPAQLSVTEYSDQNPQSTNLFLARGGLSNNTKSFRLYTENNNQFLAALQGDFHILDQGNLKMYTTSNPNSSDLKVQIASNGNSFFLGGNVGIGSQNPQEKFVVQGNTLINGKATVREKLFVGEDYNPSQEVDDYRIFADGGILCTKVQILYRNNWPDYVFEKNYARLSLPDLEKYINKNGRLPNIPSAAEVKEKGIDVGEMQKKLLEKLEEMTLYMLEQQKEIEGLTKELHELKSSEN